MTDLTVTRNDDAHRYEGRLDGAGVGSAGDTATIDFRVRTDTDPHVVTMIHTEVPESMRGEGVGGELVRQSLDDVRAQGATLLPQCEFVRSWVESHPSYQDLLDPDVT